MRETRYDSPSDQEHELIPQTRVSTTALKSVGSALYIADNPRPELCVQTVAGAPFEMHIVNVL